MRRCLDVTGRAIILLDERVQSVTIKMDKLADAVRGIAERLVRVETIIEIARQDGTVLRIAARPDTASHE
ncbi:MAG TPA: hypothetical protein VIZ17_17415 [Acetobacteraceae bacterium]